MIQLLKWTRNAPNQHRAYAPDGVYFIDRYAKRGDHPAFWTMTFFEWDAPEGERVSTVEWKAPDTWKHTLEHAKASCQRHANTRLTSRLEAEKRRALLLTRYAVAAHDPERVLKVDSFKDELAYVRDLGTGQESWLPITELIVCNRYGVIA